MVSKKRKSNPPPELPPIANFSLEDFDRVIEAEKQRERDLRARAKPLHELLAYELFTVDHVLSQDHATVFSPRSEIVIGGYSPSYNGGHVTEETLYVLPKNKSIPIRELKFNGSSGIIGGNYIKALISKYQANVIDPHQPNRKQERIYLPRDEFRYTEQTIELILLSSDEKILRTWRAANYHHHMEGKYIG